MKDRRPFLLVIAVGLACAGLIAASAMRAMGQTLGSLAINSSGKVVAPSGFFATNGSQIVAGIPWSMVNGIGLESARPAANTTNASRFWFSTDTSELSISTGSNWVTITAPATGGDGVGLTNVSLTLPTGLAVASTNNGSNQTLVVTWSSTIPDSSLSANIPRLDGHNVHTGTNEFQLLVVQQIDWDTNQAAARESLGLGSAATNDASAFETADTDLAAVAALSSTGLVQRTGPGAFSLVDPGTLGGGGSLPAGAFLEFPIHNGSSWVGASTLRFNYGQDNFLFDAVTRENYWTTFNGNSGSIGPVNSGSFPGALGVLRLYNATSTNAYAGICQRTTAWNFGTAGKYCTIWRVQLLSTNSANEKFEVALGFSDKTTASAAVDEVVALYNWQSANWQIRSSSNSVSTVTTAGTYQAIDDVWVWGAIVVDTSVPDAKLWVGGTEEVMRTNLVATATINLPLDATRMLSVTAYTQKEGGDVGTGDDSLLIDGVVWGGLIE